MAVDNNRIGKIAMQIIHGTVIDRNVIKSAVLEQINKFSLELCAQFSQKDLLLRHQLTVS